MMEKEFIPYEQALELKELGFDRTCLAGYADKVFYLSTERNNSLNKTFVAAPLYQQAFQFFREEYAIDSYIKPIIDGGLDVPKAYHFVIIEDSDDVWYDTYEEAELACLKKLIEIIKKK